MLYKTVAIFDLDKTILDSERKIRRDLEGAFARLGVILDPEEEIGHWDDLCKKYDVPFGTFRASMGMRESWEDSLRKGNAPLFDDAQRTLEKLKLAQVGLALLTRSQRYNAFTKVRHHGLGVYFGDRIMTTRPDRQIEPNKVLGARALLESFGPAVQEAYFIGDKLEDVEPARVIAPRNGGSHYGLLLRRGNESAPEGPWEVIRTLDEAVATIIK